MVFQSYALYPHMTVAENIGYALKVAGIHKSERDRKISTVATMLGLGEFLERKPSQLSGGQRQRLAIARALVRKPSIYILDDSFSALDYTTDAKLRAELHTYAAHSTLIVVAQRVSTILSADKIIVLEDGRIVGTGNHHELMDTCQTYKEIVLSQLSPEEAA